MFFADFVTCKLNLSVCYNKVHDCESACNICFRVNLYVRYTRVHRNLFVCIMSIQYKYVCTCMCVCVCVCKCVYVYMHTHSLTHIHTHTHTQTHIYTMQPFMGFFIKLVTQYHFNITIAYKLYNIAYRQYYRRNPLFTTAIDISWSHAVITAVAAFSHCMSNGNRWNIQVYSIDINGIYTKT